MVGDLTSPQYWAERQKKPLGLKVDKATKYLLDKVVPFLRPYSHKAWIELGCSPGRMSAFLYQRVPFIPFGVDFSPRADLYVDAMAHVRGEDAVLYKCDLREFRPREPFDVVASFGLVDHFSDPQEILDHHYRLCKDGGLIVVTIPHLRYLQWLYHFLFDRRDLSRHNIEMMHFETFEIFARRKNLNVLCLDYVGRMNFWNVDLEGPALVVVLRRAMSLFVRGGVNYLLSALLPPNRKIYAPWIVFVGRKS
jgi:cyclopropane fatty-acyl-phospholipid synthase-like methyltransferase